MQHNTLTFPITDTFIAMVSSCRTAKDHRQTWGSDQQGPAIWLVKDHGIYLMSNGVSGFSCVRPHRNPFLECDMSDFSTVSVDAGCRLFPRCAWDEYFQSKDFPEHESETMCIDGTIRSDGLFVRYDGRWNPMLNGWVQLRSSFGPDVFFCVRFVDGKVSEVKEGRLPWSFDGLMAGESPNDWREVPLTIE